MNKKYYWLKLHNDFFRQAEIKKLRSLENGNLYTLIYLKLQLLSITTDGKLFSKGLEDNLALDLALEIDETAENVQHTLFFLEKYHLLETIDDDCLLLIKVASIIGSEASSTERVRKMRLNIIAPALQCNSDVTKSNTELELKLEIKKEIKKELYSDKELQGILASELDKVLPVQLAVELNKVLAVQLPPKLVIGCATPMPVTNPLCAKKIAVAVEPIATVTQIALPFENILPTNLSAKQIRIARDNLQEEQVTMQKMQVITARILSRLKDEKPTSKVPIALSSPVIYRENFFEDFWKTHPNAYDRASTFQVWQKILAQGIAATDLVYAAKKYALKVKNKQTLLCYISSSRNFLLNNKFWEFLPTYSVSCTNCHGKGSFSKTNTTGEQIYYSCNCHQRYQTLSHTNLTVPASA